MNSPSLKRAADSTASSSTRSKSSTVFSENKKAKIQDMYDNRCWFCSQKFPDIAHIVAQADRSFHRFKQLGRFNIKDLSSIDNALPLCPSCHSQYDDAWEPGIVIVPTSIRFFYDVEFLYQQNDEIFIRIPPSIDDYRRHCGQENGTYQAYLTYDWMGIFNAFKIGIIFSSKEWHGDPMAILHRAFRQIACSPQGLPATLISELKNLQDLYDSSHRIKKSILHRITEDDDAGNALGKDGTRNSQPRNSKDSSIGMKPLCPPTTLPLETKPLGSRSLPPTRIPRLPPSPTTSMHDRSIKRVKIIDDYDLASDRIRSMNTWRYGPHATAQDIIDGRMSTVIALEMKEKCGS